MKKGTCILLVYAILMTFLVVAPFTANANEKDITASGDGVTSGTTGDCTWKIEDEVLTISGNGAMKNYNGYGDAPWHFTKFTEAVIEDGVINIGAYAFNGCENLTTINISDSVTSIGSSAFEYSTCLSSIDIPDSITYIGSNAFNDTLWFKNQPDGLIYVGKVAYRMKGSYPTEVKIKDGTVSITDSAFFDCRSLTTIDIPESVTYIGNNAFRNCWNLASIEIPNSVTSIGKQAFYYCSKLTSATIGNSVMSIGSYAFYDCKNITSIEIPDSVTSIGDYAFSAIENLTKATIGNSVTSIGSYAFKDCKNLKDVIIGNSIISIGNTIFSGCSGLASLTIGDSVEDIASRAFYNCTELKSVTIPATVTDIYEKAFGYYEKEGFGEAKIKDFTIYGYTGSEAQNYATNNNFTFVALDEEPTEPTTQIIRGDTDGDGIVTVIDSTMIQRYLAGLEIPVENIGEPIVK